MNNPYHPPNASVTVSHEMAVKKKRPFLIWITQALVIIFILILIAGFGIWIFSFIKAPSPMPAWVFVLISIPKILVIATLVTLFIGLVRPKRWAWHGSILFAILLLIFSVYSQTLPTPDAAPIVDGERFGYAIGNLLIIFLHVLYPFRLYFSKSVRAFFSRS